LIQMALHFWLLSTVGEAKSGSIHLLFILISVSLSALSVDSGCAYQLQCHRLR